MTVTGGPAFPVAVENAGPNTIKVGDFEIAPDSTAQFHGMSLRDYFAAQAVIGMLADTDSMQEPVPIARAAYAFADAMLAERSK